MSSGALRAPGAAWSGPARIGPVRLTATNASVRFAVRFLRIFTIRGSFGQVEGELAFDQSRLAATLLEARVPVTSLHTGNRLRDAHLRSRSWFDAQRHSHIAVRAVGVESGGSDLRVTAAVTIKGRESPVVMHCSARSAGGVPVELVGRFTIPRSPYGVGPPPYGIAPWDPRAYLVDDGVHVELRVRLDQ